MSVASGSKKKQKGKLYSRRDENSSSARRTIRKSRFLGGAPIDQGGTTPTWEKQHVDVLVEALARVCWKQKKQQENDPPIR